MSVTPNCVDSKSEMLGETVINIFNGDANKHMLSVHQTHMRLQQKNGKEHFYSQALSCEILRL